MARKQVNIAIVGTGFIAETRARAYAGVVGVEPRLVPRSAEPANDWRATLNGTIFQTSTPSWSRSWSAATLKWWTCAFRTTSIGR